MGVAPYYWRVKAILSSALKTTPHTYQIMLANKMQTLLCLYVHLWSVGSVDRLKMQGTGVVENRLATARFPCRIDKI